MTANSSDHGLPPGRLLDGDSADALVGVVEWVVDEEDEDFAEGVMAELAAQGFEVSDWSTLSPAPPHHVVLRAFFAVEQVEDVSRKLESEAASAKAAGGLTSVGKVLCDRISNLNWAEEVRKKFTAFTVGRFHIRPPWDLDEKGSGGVGNDSGHGVRDDAKAGEFIDLVIVPGAAFGTGRHPTTRLCLRALDKLADSEKPPSRLLDLGAGSGLLALAAARLWPNVEVTACEPDADALSLCRDNLQLNRLDSRVDAVSDCTLSHRAFDLVVANIRLKTLLEYREDFARWLPPGGLLVLSGLLVEEREQMLAGLQSVGSWGLLFDTREDEWRCLVLRAKGR